jgi:hypothetical protein
VPGLILAAVTPDNTPHGYNWTFAFPMLLFIVVALVLYVLFSRPHRRVPGEPVSATASGRLAQPPAAHLQASAELADGSDEAPGHTDPADVDAAGQDAAPTEGTVQADAVQAETVQAETVQADAGQADTGQAETGQADTGANA